MELNKYIEHTLLKQDATKLELIKLLDEAKEYSFLGVCVNPVNVAFAHNYLKGKNIVILFEKDSTRTRCAFEVAAMEEGKNVGVMMPYSDNLKLLADWYCQLWAESLGKNVTLDGKPCNVGQTPVKSLGVTDQHSQVQLYTEGPFDKVVTFLSLKKY